MFAPLTLGSLTFRNRVVASPVQEEASADGTPGGDYAERLVDDARRGPALVLAAPVAVSAAARVTPLSPTIASDEHVAAWGRVVRSVHDLDVLIGIQLGHAGRRGATQPRSRGVDLPLKAGGWPLLSASPLPYTPLSATPKEMDAADRGRVAEEFALAAARAAAAGFDLIELDFAHGYLLASFLSPLTNRRDDEYGGEMENRLRFPLEVLDAVSTALPGGGATLAARVPASDFVPKGLSPEDGVTIGKALAGHGCRLHHVTAGQTVVEDRPDYRRAFLTEMSDLIRAEAGVPTLVGGYITTEDDVNTIVGAGRADLCILDA
jgi:anthraniloyl-CoA monooxygenase